MNAASSVFSKLAMSRFKERLVELGYAEEFVKSADSGADFAQGSQAIYNALIYGSPSGKPTRGGLFSRATPRRAKEIAESLGRGEFSRAGNMFRQVGQSAGRSAGRGMSRLGAFSSLHNIKHQIAGARNPGEGFFESMGRRAGNITGNVLSYVPGPTGLIGKTVSGVERARLAGALSSMAGAAAGSKELSSVGRVLSSVPTLGQMLGTAGRGADKAVGAAKAVAMSGRRAFGGGKSQAQKKLEAISKAPSPRTQAGREFIMKADYQR
jgi:hypothetical protein